MSVLHVQNVGKSYTQYASEFSRLARFFGMPFDSVSENWVLRNVSFDIQEGESIGVVGKNGAGKSTLLKLITGVLQPTEGIIQVNGRVAAILELGMGFNPDLTARANVFHALSLMGYGHQEITAVLPEVEAFAEIGEYFNAPLRTYSSGMQMRVAFAVVTAFRPDVLIVDEALSVGDAYFQAKCYERITSYRKLGMSLLLVTHSTADIVKHCDKAIFIKDGHLALEGHPKDVTNAYMSSLQIVYPKEENSENLLEETFTLASSVDKFHTRPGYRKEEHRWGNGGASITDYLIRSENGDFPSIIQANETINFYFSVLFDDDYEDVTPGFLLKTIDGVFLYGTNCFQAAGYTCSVKKGQMVSYHFSMPIQLNSGHYLVSFGVATGAQEALVPLDRRYDSVLLTVTHPLGVWGLVDLKSTFEHKVVSNA